jgi:hypothetical protein
MGARPIPPRSGVMPGWILERKLRSGATVFDIGYRMNGRLVKRKAGSTRREAESALVLALAEIESGAIRDHTTETLGAYATRWLARRKTSKCPEDVEDRSDGSAIPPRPAWHSRPGSHLPPCLCRRC